MDLRDSRTTCKHDVHALYVSRLKKTACKKAIAKSEHTSDGLGLPKWLVQVAKALTLTGATSRVKVTLTTCQIVSHHTSFSHLRFRRNVGEGSQCGFCITSDP